MTSLTSGVLENDPRPTRCGLEVCLRAVSRHASDVAVWAAKRGYSDDPEFSIIALAEALEHASGKPERACQSLNVLHGWEEDQWLLNHALMASKHLKECWEFILLCWVIRTGIRVMANVDDNIIFFDGEHQRKGVVTKVMPESAAAIVKREDGDQVYAFAEHIMFNMSRGEQVAPIRKTVKGQLPNILSFRPSSL